MTQKLRSDPETTPQLAERWGVTRARVHQLIQAGGVRGAVKFGRDWLVYGSPSLDECNLATRNTDTLTVAGD